MTHWYRSSVARGIETFAEGETAARPRVDREKGIIYGYSVLTKGPTKDGRYLFDDASLEQVLSLANAQANGVKARFAHPSMSGDGVGTFLGRSKNFRLDGDQIRADLHLAEVSHKSPRGDIGTYVLDLAEEDPDAFGASVAVRMVEAETFRRSSDGTKATDENGNTLPPLARVERLHAVDIVDQPAANAGLFDDGSPDAGARSAALLLDSLFGDMPPDAVRARVSSFVDRYLSERSPEMSDTPNGAAPSTPEIATNPAPETPTQPAANGAANGAAAKPAEQQFSAAEIEAAKEAEKVRSREIVALCEAAGNASLARKFIDGNFTVDAARTELFNELCKSRKVVGDAGEGDQPPARDPDQKFKEEYATDRLTHERFGVSEREYINSRRLDEGLPRLVDAK